MAEKLITLAGCHTKSAFLHIVKHLGKNTEIEAGDSWSSFICAGEGPVATDAAAILQKVLNSDYIIGN